MAEPLRAGDPRSIGRYQTVSRLGEGGMGAVYLARDPAGRLVAVKVIRPEYAHEDHFRARFRSEVNRAREVPPFCTAEVLDADPDHETPYLVVEYVDGPSLNEVVADSGPLNGGSLHGVAVGVAAALAAIHGAGVIHRDLKPRNVLFALGTPKVIDFGIARPTEPTSFHTRAEEVVGTLAYMAPERLDPESEHLVTPAVDIFSWGAVVTYAGTGRTPFGGDTPAVTAGRILTMPPRMGDLPPYLADLVAAALDKNPANRPTAPELLDQLLVSGAPSAPPLPVELRREAEAAQQSGRYHTGGTRKPSRKRGVAAIVGVAAAVVVASVGVGVTLRQSGSTPAAAPAAASAAASGSPSAAGSSPAVLTGPAVFDSLLREAFVNTASDDDGACTYRNGLRVTAKSGKSMRCGSYLRTTFPAGQSVDVTASLNNSHSCAAIWFRTTTGNEDESYAPAYEMVTCPDRVSLSSTIDGGYENKIAEVKLSTSLTTKHRLRLVADDEKATLSIDGAPVLQGELSESTLISGQVMIGTVASGGKGDITFTDAEMRSGTTPGVPAVPAFTTGDAQFTAGFYYLYNQGRVAILEPTEYVTGAEYCRRYALDSGSSKCAKKYVPIASATEVSLPIAADPTYLDYRRDTAKCEDPVTHAGTCPVSFAEFTTVSDLPQPWPALVTIKDGKVDTVAYLNLGLGS